MIHDARGDWEAYFRCFQDSQVRVNEAFRIADCLMGGFDVLADGH